FIGLNQIGDAGLKDRVNHHYLATFGAAAAVGLISGLSQYIGSAGLGRGDGDDRTVVIAGGIGDATTQATMQVMNRFLNRLPTITIREGHRVKVYLTSDLELPAYTAAPGRFCRGGIHVSSPVDRPVRRWSRSGPAAGADRRDRSGEPDADHPDTRAH